MTRSLFWNLPMYLDKNLWLAQIVRVLHLRLSTVELDKSNCQVAFVKWSAHTLLRSLLKSLDKGQYVKSTCQVNLKGDPYQILRWSTSQESPQRGTRKKVRSRSWQKRKSKLITFGCFLPNNFQCKRCSWNYFFIDLYHDSDTKGRTSLT